MSGTKNGDEEPGWRQCLRIGAFLVGLAAIAAGPLLLNYLPNPNVGWASMITGLIFMMSSRFDDVVEIGFGSFRTKLERRVKKVEDTMAAVRRLAKESARSALKSVQYAGRLGGFTDTEKERFLRDTRRLLHDLGIQEGEAADVEREWHEAVEFDYAHWVLGGDRTPKDLPKNEHGDWDELRSGGIAGRATPVQIRRFLENAQMLTQEREEILQDYEHYRATRQHRREDDWLRRHER